MASYPSGLRDRFAKPSFAGSNPADASPVARVVELVDTADLKSVVRMDVPVRVRPWVLWEEVPLEPLPKFLPNYRGSHMNKVHSRKYFLSRFLICQFKI